MKGTLSIARRELSAYFQTPVGWLVLCAFMVITGFFFASMVTFYSLQSTEMGFDPYSDQALDMNEYLVSPFFGSVAVILLLLAPAITMRLFAEDRRSGALELLLTSPLSTTQIVLGKYLGALGFVTLMLACTLHYAALLVWLGEPDLGVLACSYVATFLLAAAFLSVGTLASAFTDNQLVALVVAFGTLMLFWVVAWADATTVSGWREVLAHASILSHMERPMRGLLHLQDGVYYASFIGFFLFAAHQRVDSFRWS